MNLTPDEWIFWQWGPVNLDATIVFTWMVMALLVVGSWLVSRKLSTGTELSHWQNLLEVIVGGMRDQIQEVSHQRPEKYLPFIGTLFLYIATCNLLVIIPQELYVAPTGSLSTTAALAACVFIAVPVYGILHRGFFGYLKQYVQPTWFMLPFNVFGELSRTLALAVRLFGNIMSGTVIAGILLSLVPLFVPVVMHLLGLLTGMIQAYIFAVLAMVYIASATQAHEVLERERDRQPSEDDDPNV